MPTAIKVKDEKKANTKMVKFETSTSPSWKDIKIFIKNNFLNINIITKIFFTKNHKFKRMTKPNTNR